MDAVRVLTFNVLARDRANGSERERLVRDGLRELAPDIIALQEVTRDEDVDQAGWLLGDAVTILDHPSTPPDSVGACLAVRWPVEAVDTLDLHVGSQTAALPWAGAVAARVRVPPPVGTLLVVHHKPSWELTAEALRERQALATARWVEDLVGDDDLPIIVLGDFDAAPDAASMRFWTGRQSLEGTSVRYEDAWAACHRDGLGLTFDPTNPLVRAGEMSLEGGRRIDYILIRCGVHGPALEVTSCRTVFDRAVDSIWPSDHFGVLAELRRPSRPPGAGWSPG
jgi:endonuclease/exonuclease/phosphatase family metal-dependent hydrolase